MNKDLEIIKKKYGENMAHLCRELFPTILEEEGRLPEILQNNFAVSRNLGDDITSHNYKNNFQGFLMGCADIDVARRIDTNESPDTLLNKAGYNFYECTTNAEIERFKKYYINEELLCTFSDPARLQKNHVFFAVKKNVDEIKRSSKPQREDEYGTSVISIQFLRGKTNVTSIKNRYNVSVDNPDATFSNNLDNIIPGLTSSFEKQYNLNIRGDYVYFELPNYKLGNDKRYYRYYHNIDNVYYCENNIIIDNDTIIRDYQMPERYVFMDNYILDLSKKEVKLYNNDSKDGFVDSLNDISKVDIQKDKKTGNKTLIIKNSNNELVEILLNKNNNIIKYKNEKLIDAGDNFLKHSKNLEELEVPNLRKAGKNFLKHNKKLIEFNQPLLEEVPDGCLEYNEIINKVNIENASRIGDNFLNTNKDLKELNAPNAKTIGRGLLEWNRNIDTINIPKVEKIDDYFLTAARHVSINGSTEKIDLDTTEIGDGFLSNHELIKEVKLNKTKELGSGFLSGNEIIEKAELKELESVGSSFLTSNKKLKSINLSNSTYIGDDFLSSNKILEKIDISKAETLGNRFLKENEKLRELNIDNVKEIGHEFMPNNRKVKIYDKNLTFKEKFFTNHVRKIKKTFEVIKKITIYDKKALSYNQELIRGNHNGQMMFNNPFDTAASMVDELNNNEYKGRRK